ncbi:VOC family protein [Microlunatus flavus]|uniref:PhnB protein n=1 Tax=Microlunatus flavus TaxID=1036181 RepID=A0A1H9KV39_9ACTN|nr:VOC family protein [Microlunatus flavus]SER02653.1 PhnB protein [Microlunatus flavus]
MALTTTTHLNFDGDARAALDFYGQVFGAEPVVVTYAMAHSADQVDDPERVIFGQVETAAGFRVMAYDVQHGRAYDPGQHPFYVSVRADSEDEARGIWDRLSVEATVVTPFGPSMWSPAYGMATDRFGVTWFVDVTPQG